ncbi:WhiB family transcriptional regulator [Geodermatophilus nigrescens]
MDTTTPPTRNRRRQGAAAKWRYLLAALQAAGPVPCQQGPSSAWWPEPGGPRDTIDAAVDECRRCPALSACRDYAVAAGEQAGIWGGTLPTERRALR